MAITSDLTKNQISSRWAQCKHWVVSLMHAIDYDSTEEANTILRYSASEIEKLKARVFELEEKNRFISSALNCDK